MSVSPAETASHLRARLERQRLDDVARAERARVVATELSRLLIERFGARRVLLFGSLATGHFHDRSDVDLAVEGLSADELLAAGAALDEAAAPFVLDLVGLDRMPDAFRSAVEHTGVPLP